MQQYCATAVTKRKKKETKTLSGASFPIKAAAVITIAGKSTLSFINRKTNSAATRKHTHQNKKKKLLASTTAVLQVTHNHTRTHAHIQHTKARTIATHITNITSTKRVRRPTFSFHPPISLPPPPSPPLSPSRPLPPPPLHLLHTCGWGWLATSLAGSHTLTVPSLMPPAIRP